MTTLVTAFCIEMSRLRVVMGGPKGEGCNNGGRKLLVVSFIEGAKRKCPMIAIL